MRRADICVSFPCNLFKGLYFIDITDYQDSITRESTSYYTAKFFHCSHPLNTQPIPCKQPTHQPMVFGSGTWVLFKVIFHCLHLVQSKMVVKTIVFSFPYRTASVSRGERGYFVKFPKSHLIWLYSFVFFWIWESMPLPFCSDFGWRAGLDCKDCCPALPSAAGWSLLLTLTKHD